MIGELEIIENVEMIKKLFPKKRTNEKKIAKEIGYINDAFEVDFSEYLKGTFDLFGNTHFLWKERKGVYGGEIHFLSLNDCFYKDFNLTASAKNADEKSLLENFHPFIDHPITGDGLLTGFIIDQEKDKIESWFYDNGNLFRLKIDFLNCIKYLIQFKGIFYWQYFFIDYNISSKNPIIKQRIKKTYKALTENYATSIDSDIKKYLKKLIEEL